jgi:hypothetical protein
MSNYSINVPYPPSLAESKFYYYGIPSRPRLVARSSPDVWVEPTGFEAYHCPKETRPVGLHPLCDIWEATIGPAIIEYLNSKAVAWTSLDPVRIGDAGAASPPVIIWIGVVPSTLSSQNGVDVASGCKTILSSYYQIEDVHVEIRESSVVHSVGPRMYKPAPTSSATVDVREPFSTSLGLPICNEKTPSIGGTGGFFISDPNKPNEIFLVTARHVVFHSSESNAQFYGNSKWPRKNVLLFSDDAFVKHTSAIATAITGKHDLIARLHYRKENCRLLDQEDLAAELRQVEYQLAEADDAILSLKKFNADISRQWKKREDRKVGFVVASPPIALNVGEDGFTEDWALVQIDRSKINSVNFVGNVIDLGTTISPEKISEWMYPHITNPPSFKYPPNRLLRISGVVPDSELWNLSPRTVDHNDDPCIMVIKRGHTSDLTVGRLNNIRSFTRYLDRFAGIENGISKEVVVLPRDSKLGAFSCCGDSGSAVVDGKGRLVGLITGGSGDTEVSDCTYVTSISFILKRMREMGIKANLFPSLT